MYFILFFLFSRCDIFYVPIGFVFRMISFLFSLYKQFIVNYAHFSFLRFNGKERGRETNASGLHRWFQLFDNFKAPLPQQMTPPTKPSQNPTPTSKCHTYSADVAMMMLWSSSTVGKARFFFFVLLLFCL